LANVAAAGSLLSRALQVGQEFTQSLLMRAGAVGFTTAKNVSFLSLVRAVYEKVCNTSFVTQIVSQNP
jgi:hypothetical protein